ncbi:MAG: carbohydrate binding domain-containing protein [Phycisphaerae bacterium]
MATARVSRAWKIPVLSLLIIATAIPCAQADNNLLTNPGFEYGNTEGWTAWGCDLSATREQVHTGNYSVRASNRSQSWQGPLQSMLGKMEPGKTYRITGWVRLQNASEDRIGMTVNQTDSNGTQYNGIHWSTGYNDRWIELQGTFTLNVTGSLTALNLYFEGPAPGVNFYLDDAEIVAVKPPEPNASGSVDISTAYQELEGFGASGAFYSNWLTAHPKKSEIYDVIFGQLGLDIYRIRNTYGIDIDYISRAGQIIQAAEASLGHPIKIMISSWSPPAYLKSNAGTLAQAASGGYAYSQFAKWWADSLAAYKIHGIDIDYVNIQNEPDWLADYDSCKFTPAETSEWAGYNLAFEAVYQQLASRMTDMPKLLAPESFGCSASQAFIDELIDPNHVYGFAHHYYADGNYENPDAFISAMESFAARYGDKPLFQTEYSCLCDVTPFSVALNLARHMHNSLVHEGVCSFFYWDLFWGEEGGLVTLDFPWQDNPGYKVNHIYYAFKQYSAFTDPGWHRVEASTNSTGLRISAFKSEDDTELSIVIINVSDIDIDLALSLGCFSPDSSRVYRTCETEYTQYLGAFDESQSLTLPSESITTVSLIGSYSPNILSVEGFETGDFSSFDWESFGDEIWSVTSGERNSGTYSAKAGSIGDGENSTLKVTLDCVSGDISFYYKVSSELRWDFLRFYMDGVKQGEWSGEEDWTQISFPVLAGQRTFTWVYSKDESSSDGDDSAWIDDIVFPVPGNSTLP